MNNSRKPNVLEDIDPRLLEEAFHRARSAQRNKQVDSSALLAAIIAEARRGTRHMFGLVSAASRVSSVAA